MINFDGTLHGEESQIFGIRNRGFTHGDALLEVVRVAPGKLYFWEDHYLRLMASMRLLRMEIPMTFTLEFLEEELQKTLEASELHNVPALATLYVFRRNGDAEANEISYVITATAHTSPFYEALSGTFEVDLYKDHYRQAGMLSNLSTTNRVLATIGRVYARENGYDSCLLLNDQKNVVQALEGNIFWVKDSTIKTPPLSDGCENGVIRKKIIEIIRKVPAYTLEEVSISPFDLQKADELFITNISKGIQPVRQYRKAQFQTNVANDLLGKLNALARLS